MSSAQQPAGSAGHPTDSFPLPRPAGPLRRLLATLLDMVLFCGLSVLLAWPVARSVDWSALPTDLQHVTDAVSDPGWISHASGILGMWIALWWSYFAVGWGLFGATPGKWILGLRIVDHRYRSPIGLSRGVMRLVAYTVSSLTLGIGHLLMLFRSDRCALHDVLAGTRVVRRQPSAPPATTAEEDDTTS